MVKACIDLRRGRAMVSLEVRKEEPYLFGELISCGNLPKRRPLSGGQDKDFYDLLRLETEISR